MTTPSRPTPSAVSVLIRYWESKPLATTNFADAAILLKEAIAEDNEPRPSNGARPSDRAIAAAFWYMVEGWADHYKAAGKHLCSYSWMDFEKKILALAKDRDAEPRAGDGAMVDRFIKRMYSCDPDLDERDWVGKSLEAALWEPRT